MSYLNIVKSQLATDEGWKRKPYKDTVGKLTIGCGRNLDDVGLRDDEISVMLDNDLRVAENTAVVLFQSFPELNDQRKAVLINMAFNLGQDRLSKFSRFRAAVEAGNFDLASIEMIDSAWATQVGDRAHRLADKMKGD